MSSKIAPILFFLLLFTGCSIKKIALPDQLAQVENIKIFGQRGGLGPCEPSIQINPQNPNQVVAGSVIDFVHTSADGGKTWQTERLGSSLGIWGDPVILADNQNNFYYFHLSDIEGTNWASDKILDRIVVQRSSNGGISWTEGTGIGLNPPKQQDKEWAAVDPTTGDLVVTWTEFDNYGSDDPDCHSRILFSRSSDKGENWTSPVKVNQHEGNCLDGDKTTEGAVPTIDKKGNIYVSWSYDDKIFFDRSEDGGETWLEEDIVVSDQIGGWSTDVEGLNRVNGMPVTVVDNSDGPHQGRIYINWTDERNGPENPDVFISHSDDKGNTWSSPKRINNDNTDRPQFLTWMDVDEKTGLVYIIYYDRSRYADKRTDVKLAISNDGGNNFKNYVISESPFDPTRSTFFGDYNNIHVYDGQVRPVWTRYENGEMSIWTALIDMNK